MAEQKAWRMDFDSVEGLAHKNKLDPPGFEAALAKDWNPGGSTSLQKRRDPQMIAKKQQALMAAATAPLKQAAFMCFMMWMMGNGIQIFSIIMTLSGLASPLMAIANSGKVFPADPDRKLDTFTPRLLFCVIHMGQFIFGLYKLNAMGLLPTHASDWLSAMAAPKSLEQSYGAL